MTIVRKSVVSTPVKLGRSSQFPIESMMNWVGGVAKPEAAIQLLAQGGIPVVAQTQGGVIKFVKLEQVWVEAWIASVGCVVRRVR